MLKFAPAGALLVALTLPIFSDSAEAQHGELHQDSGVEEGFKSLVTQGTSGWTSGINLHHGILTGRGWYHRRSFSDFHLKFDFKLHEGSNSGIGLRTPIEAHPAYEGMEIQVLDDTAPRYEDLRPWQYHGSVYGVAAANRGHLMPVGQWNSEEIIARGNHIVVILNGTTIVDVDLAEVAKGGTLDGYDHPGLFQRSGYLSILGHGAEGDVEFRNLRIKDLAPQPAKPSLGIAWSKNLLTITGPQVPGSSVIVNYIEAYCRDDAHQRDWSETTIPHKTELVEANREMTYIHLRDRLEDGVVVDHWISTSDDEVDFRLIARNPTDRVPEVRWAQPCVRVDRFTGASRDDERTTVPDYARRCFLFLDGQLTRLPTGPWATEALYTPGQVYRSPEVDANHMNPRPLSPLVPSCGLIGCFSADEKHVLATAWQPYHELFQGVISCIHCDFRVGRLDPHQDKRIRGKVYIVPADIGALVERYQRDFADRGS